MDTYIDEILLTMPDGSEQAVRMKFGDGVAIQVDGDGDVPLFEDPLLMTYPSTFDVKDNPSLADEIRACTGRPFDPDDPCYFDIAIAFGLHHKLSEIVKH